MYAWLNGEHTLRKAGVRSDVYAIFAAMLARGTPPSDIEQLRPAAAAVRGSGAQE